MSKVLWNLYLQGVGREEHPEGQGERLHPTLPIYANREARLFVMWDHTPRMSWQTPAYYEGQRRTLRPNTFARLHENRWVTAESAFITRELWRSNIAPTHGPVPPDRSLVVFVGLDAGLRSDNLALVGVAFDDAGDLGLVHHAIFRPSKGETLNLEATAGATLRQWAEDYTLHSVSFDPWQLLHFSQERTSEGLPMREFTQTTENLTRMASTLDGLLTSGRLCLYEDAELEQQAMNAIAVEGVRGLKISKERASRKIDAIAALAMACVAALDSGPRNFRGYVL